MLSFVAAPVWPAPDQAGGRARQGTRMATRALGWPRETDLRGLTFGPWGYLIEPVATAFIAESHVDRPFNAAPWQIIP